MKPHTMTMRTSDKCYKVWIRIAIGELALGIRVLGSVEKEKLVVILNGNYFPVHSFYFTRNFFRVTKI
jgi:hypothetical protein